MKKALAILTLLPALLFGISCEKQHTSSFTHQEVEEIDPSAVLSLVTLSGEYGLDMFSSDLVRDLEKKGIVTFTPFTGLSVINPQDVKIIIESYGGDVGVGIELINRLDALKKRGITYTCYVSKAASMAFTVMLSVCDRTVATKGVYLMQHRVRYRNGYTDASTLQIDIELSKKEAKILGVDHKFWRALARGPEDHVFTLGEIMKYKLVDEWM